ncbi:NifU family protein [Halanaeroarchaeum sulfurireducens]|uniref:Nitrogen-fixing protein NifU n=1 Tax=Halanaeroarchaeum sulfurireducens TaxID=1604004 RepID=A0A0F7PB72_9EURY|nr:NifU family protein [Halanaeroarchaeum sulfurireducens]AKH96884.1 nitrogen-fixing protein NifU [Halanaeroarchaeum sulfurireducens]ALG81286.1 nitrogen-fixing protein NifU [Halanaeroarchaeum sulfurireducens]
MSTDGSELRERIESWLSVQMPIIQMHGGSSAVRSVDPESGRVTVEMGGACAHCGISPRTADQVRENLTTEFDAVTEVEVQFLDDREALGVDQAESVMGVDRTQGGRGGDGKGHLPPENSF